MKGSKTSKRSTKNNTKDVSTSILHAVVTELDLDPDIIDCDSPINKKSNRINFDLISRLPKIYNETNSINNLYDIVQESDEINMDNVPDIKVPDDIEVELLVSDILEGRPVYYDYDKLIIYNSQYLIIGSINEDGEIQLENESV